MRAPRHLLLALALLSSACDGTEDPLALGEAIVVHQADFKSGALPAAPPDAPSVEPRVTSFALGFGVLRPGSRNAQLSGRTSASAYSVAVRFRDQGDGYWVRTVGAEDPLIPGELQWQLAFDAAIEIEPGLHELELVALDERGRAGPKVSLPVCIASELPDNLNVCNPTTPPPQYIASLHWNTDSDLDLSTVAPDGTTYGRSKRSLLQGSKVAVRLDGDGVSSCLADGRRRESLVFNEPPSGIWRFYVNLFDACGKASASYTLTLHKRVQNPDGTFALVEDLSIHGQFIRAQANGGAASPLFLTEVQF
jgi:hypothetical protein